jgi:small subunit ribosomal protein S17
MPTAIPTSDTKDSTRRLHGTKIGVVVGDKRDKTRNVSVAYQVRLPKYGKYIKRQTRYYVHDEQNASKTGDVVEIVNCRPISKTKMWRLVRVVKSAVTD